MMFVETEFAVEQISVNVLNTLIVHPLSVYRPDAKVTSAQALILPLALLVTMETLAQCLMHVTVPAFALEHR